MTHTGIRASPLAELTGYQAAVTLTKEKSGSAGPDIAPYFSSRPWRLGSSKKCTMICELSGQNVAIVSDIRTKKDFIVLERIAQIEM